MQRKCMAKDIHIVFQVLNFIYGPAITEFKILDIDKHILILLAKHNGPGGIYPSTHTLAKELSKTPTYIKRRINFLEEKKLIQLERHYGRSHRYLLSEVIHSRSTTVDQSTTVDRSTAVLTTGQLQVANRSTAVDPINLNNQSRLSKQRERSFPRAARSSPTPLSLNDFSPSEANQILCRELGLDLENQVEKFKSRFKANGRNLQFEFGEWIRNDKPPSANRQGRAGGVGSFLGSGHSNASNPSNATYAGMRDWTAERLAREAEVLAKLKNTH